MIKVPTELMKSFVILLDKRGIQKSLYLHYQKWLRYYLAFCYKYQFLPPDKNSLPYFVRKLHEKNQSMYQQKQVSHTIGLHYELISSNPPKKPDKSPEVLRLPKEANCCLGSKIFLMKEEAALQTLFHGIYDLIC